MAFQIEPGVGLGLEYTDNARLTQQDQLEDLIAATYVGAKLFENEGSLKYDATATFNKHNYTQDSYPDQRYLYLGLNADWEMVKNRFNWLLSNYFRQIPVVSVNSNTPDNLQDSNAFTFGANIDFPISQRQSVNIIPLFNQYYYEVLPTDNKQYSLSAKWNYQLFRLTGIGLNASTRIIDYFEQVISDTEFTNLAFVISGQRKRSNFSINLGATNVKRDSDEDETGFSGSINWLADLTKRSKFKTLLSTGLTDTSSVNAASNSGAGNVSDVQVTTDVIRDSIFNLAYLREDESLNTRVWLEYRELTYSDNPLDREVQSTGLEFNYPVTRLLSSGAYVNYYHSEQLETQRIDEQYSVGGNLRYKFSRKLNTLVDVKYRTKESTFDAENYDEVSLFVSLVYGFGDVYRPTRAGGS